MNVLKQTIFAALGVAVVFLFFAVAQANAAEDILIADFEARNYGDWKVEGEAFGRRPARGSFEEQGQMDITGFEGRRLVNSFRGGDESTGKLTSPAFKIEREYVNFLIGGGKYPGETCINLLVGDKVVRTATGPNDEEGGSEELDWHSWDVKDLVGQQARIEIVDQRSGGWGHVTVDHIYQSSQKVEVVENKTREFKLAKKYLNFPVKTGVSQRVVSLLIDGKVVREFEIGLAPDEPQFWVFLDVSEFRGQDAVLRINKYIASRDGGFDKAFQDDTYPGEETLYTEKLRPQIHFSSKRGWNNDPNGLVYHEGEYHLFYQHNPFGWAWGNMTWGHAVSRDLVHWTELGDALHPDRLGTMFSGSAVIDKDNTTGFQTGDEKPLVCIYTSAGDTNPWSKDEPFTQGIAYSNDRGRTFTIYDGNPVLGHINGDNRDPKVFWHKPTDQWVIVLYLDKYPDGKRRMAFFTSKDLKTWEKQSEVSGFHECPELFELPVDGDANNKRWVLYGASGRYYVGDFDGREFKPDTDILRYNFGNCFYASQTFNNIPAEDGRRIQIGWGQVPLPDMPFNQMMTFPVELTLHTTDEGVRLFPYPVKEIEKIRGKRHAWSDETLEPGANLLSGVEGELFDIDAEFEVGDANEIGFVIGGIGVTYNVEAGELACGEEKASLAPSGGKVRLRLLVDRVSIEIFAGDGLVYMPMKAVRDLENQSLEVFARGGSAKVNTLEVYELKSIWQE